MVLNLVKTKEIVLHRPNPKKILSILLQWTRSNSWPLLKCLVYLCIVALNVIIMLNLFCRCVLNEFIC